MNYIVLEYCVLLYSKLVVQSTKHLKKKKRNYKIQINLVTKQSINSISGDTLKMSLQRSLYTDNTVSSQLTMAR